MSEQETDPVNAVDESAIHCPNCGQPLKRMRCRIDDSELYCPRCRHAFDPRTIGKRNMR